MKIKHSHLPYLLLLFLISLILLSPQLISKNMILGSDSLFHFNRFYDTSQQIKDLNFQYHVSLYGFQQSGRIVNALYGPFVSYFQGLLVLLSKNWFTYQVLSNLLLFQLAGSTMYFFLLKGKVEQKYAFIGSVLYLSTYSILYWVMRQGFTSWGAALLPLALSLLFDLTETKQVPRFLLGIYTALMMQTHMLSSALLVLMYLPFFVSVFLHSKQKLRFIKDMLREILIFVCLTLNVSTSYIILLMDNQLLKPFVNRRMSLSTINHNSDYWLIHPRTLLPLLIVIFLFFLFRWKKIDGAMKCWFFVMASMLLLTTSLVPWDSLVANGNPIIEFIQFPFRFFVPVSIISIYLGVKIISSLPAVKPFFPVILIVFIGISLFQTTQLFTTTLKAWDRDNFMPSKYKVVMHGDSSSIKQAFYDSDKKKALDLIAKGTPDYLPLSQGETEKSSEYYDEYIEKIINNRRYQKSVSSKGLTIEWEGQSNSFVELPVVVYTGTILTYNGQTLSKSQFRLGKLGTLAVQDRANQKNTLVLTYEMPLVEKMAIFLSGFSWLVVLVFISTKKRWKPSNASIR